MMKAFRINTKRIAAMILVIVTVLAFMPLGAAADPYITIASPDSNITRGNEFTVSVTFTADSEIGTVQAAISYSEQDMEFISSDFAFGGGGIVNIAAFPQRAASSMTVTLRFRALRQGTSMLTLSNGSVMSPDGTMLAGSLSASAEFSIGAAAADQDSSGDSDQSYYYEDSLPDELKATLKTLTVSTGELKPAFSPGIYDYTVTVPHEVEYFGIDAEPAGLYDTIWFEGSEYLADGKTLRTITVTSGDGTVSNVYTVTVIRLGEDENGEPQDPSDDTDTDGDSITDEDTEDLSSETTDPDIVQPLTSNSAAPRDRDSSIGDGKTGMQDLRDKLMPAMIVAMAAIILAVVILIVFIKKKSKNKLK